MIKKELWVVMELVFKNDKLVYTDVWCVTEDKYEAIGRATTIHYDENHCSCINGLTDKLDRTDIREEKHFVKGTQNSFSWSTEYNDNAHTRIETKVLNKYKQEEGCN